MWTGLGISGKLIFRKSVTGFPGWVQLGKSFKMLTLGIQPNWGRGLWLKLTLNGISE